MMKMSHYHTGWPSKSICECTYSFVNRQIITNDACENCNSFLHVIAADAQLM